MGFEASFFLSHQVSYKSWEFFGTANVFLARMLTIFWHLEPLSLALCMRVCAPAMGEAYHQSAKIYNRKVLSRLRSLSARGRKEVCHIHSHIALMHLYTAAHREVCSCVVCVYIFVRAESVAKGGRNDKWCLVARHHERSMAWKARAQREENREKRWESSARRAKRETKEPAQDMRVSGPFYKSAPSGIERKRDDKDACCSRSRAAGGKQFLACNKKNVFSLFVNRWCGKYVFFFWFGKKSFSLMIVAVS